MAESCNILPIVSRDDNGKPIFARVFNDLSKVFGMKIALVIWAYANTKTFKLKHPDIDDLEVGGMDSVDVIRAIKRDRTFLDSSSGQIVRDAMELLNLDGNGNPRPYRNLAKLSLKIKQYNLKYENNFSVALLTRREDPKTEQVSYVVEIRNLNQRTVADASILDQKFSELDQFFEYLSTFGIKVDLNNKSVIANSVYDLNRERSLLDAWKTIFAKVDDEYVYRKNIQDARNFIPPVCSIIVHNMMYDPEMDKLKNALNPDFIQFLSSYTSLNISEMTSGFTDQEKLEYLCTIIFRMAYLDPSILGDELVEACRNMFRKFDSKMNFQYEKLINIYDNAQKLFKAKAGINSVPKINVSNTKDENIAYAVNKLLILCGKRIDAGNVRGTRISYASFDLYRTASEMRRKLDLERAFHFCLEEIMTALKNDDENMQSILEDQELDNERRIEYANTIYRRLRTLIDLYKPIITDYINYNNSFYFTDDPLLKEDFNASLRQISDYIDNLQSRTRQLRLQLCERFLRLYYNEEEYICGPNETKPNITELLLKIDDDANIFEHFVGALTDSSDLISVILARIVKSKANKRDDLILNEEKILRASRERLRASGIESTEWMCEKDAEGNLTGNFIGEYDFVKFQQERDKAFKEIDEDQTLSNTQKFNMRYKWEKENMADNYIYKDKAGMYHLSTRKIDNAKVVRLPSQKYKRGNWSQIYNSWSDAQKDYYNTSLSEKIKFESLIPKVQRNIYRMPRISKSASQVLLEKGLNAFYEYTKNDIKTSLFRDDKSIKFKYDELDEPLDTIPISYTSKLDPKIMSTDVTSILHAYMSSVYHYSTLHDVINSLLTVKDQLKDRVVAKQSLSKRIHTNKTTKTDINNMTPEEKESITKYNFSHGGTYYDRLETFFEYYIFGSKRSDTFLKNPWNDDEFSNISVHGITNTITGYVSKVAIGLSPATSVANIIAGKYQMFIEALGGGSFSFKELLRSSATYFKNIWGYLSESGKRKTNKMAVLAERFDMLDEFYQTNLRKTYDSTALLNLWKNTNGFVMQKMGEHYLHIRTGIALMMHTRVKKNGVETNLYDAIDVDPNTGEMKIDGITTLNGTQINKEYLNNIKDLINQSNRKLHGAFNKFDRGACHNTVIGQLIMTFRQWMPAVYGHRFDWKGKTMQVLDEETGKIKNEKVYGYFIQTFKAFQKLRTEMKNGKALFSAIHSSLSTNDKIAMRKALGEIMFGVLIKCVLTGLTQLALAGGDDDDDDTFYSSSPFRFFYDQMLRLNTEVDAYSNPFGFYASIKSLGSDPITSIRQFDNIVAILDVSRWFDTVERGFFKDWPVAFKEIVMGTPYVSGIVRMMKRTNTKPKYYSLWEIDDTRDE